jgi:Protein of unknown function (DUF1449)
MLSVFLAPDYMPFAVAFAVMLGVGLIEAIGLGLGHIDADMDVDGDGPTALNWLGMGKGLPLLIWLTSLLGCFTLAGVAIQQIATSVLGGTLHWPLASAGALLFGGGVNRFVARGLSRIMPSYESSVISTVDLLMRHGTVLEGTARRGHPARAKVVDQHHQAHYIMIEPHGDDDVIGQGETALLVRKEGTLFFGVPDAHPTLRPL